MRVAIFASGSGSNFQALAEKFATGELPGKLTLLFCDQPKAYVLERAKSFGVTTLCFSPKDFANKQAYEAELLARLQAAEIDLIVLAGYMRLIGSELLAAYPQKIINIHPSLLPAFPGLHGIKDAFDYGVKITGVTVHYIDAGVDTGQIIEQAAVRIDEKDTLETLEAKIHRAEHELYPAVLAKILN